MNVYFCKENNHWVVQLAKQCQAKSIISTIFHWFLLFVRAMLSLFPNPSSLIHSPPASITLNLLHMLKLAFLSLDSFSMLFSFDS